MRKKCSGVVIAAMIILSSENPKTTVDVMPIDREEDYLERALISAGLFNIHNWDAWITSQAFQSLFFTGYYKLSLNYSAVFRQFRKKFSTHMTER